MTSLAFNEQERGAPESGLERGTELLRFGALLNGAVAVLLILAGAAAAVAGGGLMSALGGIVLARYNGAPDTALLAAILLAFADVGLFLIVRAGALAREGWALIALIGVILADAAGVMLLGWLPGILPVVMGALALTALWRDRSLFRVNPVALKELRGRMRGVRAFSVMTIYLLLMSGFAILLYIGASAPARSAGSSVAGEVGRILFLGIVAVELILIGFVAPSFTAGAITGERERQTLDLLQTTLLSPSAFVMGKLESALGFLLLLLLAAIPLQSIAFLFGGVSEQEILIAFVILLATALLFGTIGLYYSAVMPRTLNASSRAYGTIVTGLFAVPLAMSFALNALLSAFFSQVVTPNIAGLETVLRYLDLILVSLNPIAAALASQQLLINQQQLLFYDVTLRSNGSSIPMPSAWVVLVVLYVTIAAVLILRAFRRTQRAD